MYVSLCTKRMCVHSKWIGLNHVISCYCSRMNWCVFHCGYVGITDMSKEKHLQQVGIIWTGPITQDIYFSRQNMQKKKLILIRANICINWLNFLFEFFLHSFCTINGHNLFEWINNLIENTYEFSTFSQLFKVDVAATFIIDKKKSELSLLALPYVY